MVRRTTVSRGFAWTVLCAAVGLTLGAAVYARGAPSDDDLVVHRSRTTGLATFVTARDGGPIAVEQSVADSDDKPMSFLRHWGHLFGVTDPAEELRQVRVTTDSLGQTHVTYQQVYDEVPVFSGELKVHQDAGAAVVAANGDFYPILDKIDPVPTVSVDAAVQIAASRIPEAELEVEQVELVIVDPGWYGDPPAGAHLAYHLVLADLPAGVREAFFIEAHSGRILDQWNLIHTARWREIYNGGGSAALPGLLWRSEGEPPSEPPDDVNKAYDYAGDTYDFFSRAFGRDSIDDEGMPLVLTVNSRAIACPNAFWRGSYSAYCNGTVTDDVVAHEKGHGITQFTANLIYQNQPGQLNESFSDVWGELVDLFNGDVAYPGPPAGTPWPKDEYYGDAGTDTPNDLRTGCYSSRRWLVAEDSWAFGGAIRDMWNPTCEGDPDRAYSPLQTCSSADNGGVHSGSGIPNHAFAMLTDGKSFNGHTVDGIGPIKTAAVWYRALTVYLTPASDFEDAYYAFNQAAQDLVGTYPNDPRTGSPSAEVFTADDAVQADEALLAVEMNTEGRCGANVPVLNPDPPAQCSIAEVIYSEDFEHGPAGWTTSIGAYPAPDTPYVWERIDDLPHDRPGIAWFCADLVDLCAPGGDESATHFLYSPAIDLPVNLLEPTLAFTHYMACEPGWDGGNVKINVDGGFEWPLIPKSAFTYNAYNTTLNSAAEGSTNPLAGQRGWSGAGGGWGTSVVDLSEFVAGGETIRLQFDFGKDY
ncbi:MAG: M4 family metallopeptidase, partial [Planctomycetes bacterium]|nr:M4 family metallopeptidase [Planctomycetota bacterium]